MRLLWNAPPIHRSATVELDEPYRIGRSFIFHLWPTTLALAVGRWHEVTAEYTDEHGDPRFREERDALQDAIHLKAGAPAAELQEGVRMPPVVPTRKVEDIQAYRNGQGKVVVDYAPKFGRIDIEEAARAGTYEADYPRWHGKDNVYKIGKYRYVRRGLVNFGREEWVERVDRRGPIKFLFGGNSTWSDS